MSLRILGAIAAVTTAVLFPAAASAAAPGDTDLGSSARTRTDSTSSRVSWTVPART